MPNDKIAEHPSKQLSITFHESDHSYIDEFGTNYTSGTTLMNSGFEPFNGPAIAAAKSAKTGVPAEEYLRQWAETGKQASESGTRAHENCERQILGRYADMHQPNDDEEKIRFRAAWEETEKIKAAFQRLEPEKLVFSPRFRVAGSLDILAQKSELEYAILDWKYIKGIEREGFKGKMGNQLPTFHLPDCNFFHYALQLSIYQNILLCEGYIPAQANVNRWLLVYNKQNQAFDYVNLPFLGWEAMTLMAYNNTNDGLDGIPF